MSIGLAIMAGLAWDLLDEIIDRCAASHEADETPADEGACRRFVSRHERGPLSRDATASAMKSPGPDRSLVRRRGARRPPSHSQK